MNVKLNFLHLIKSIMLLKKRNAVLLLLHLMLNMKLKIDTTHMWIAQAMLIM